MAKASASNIKDNKNDKDATNRDIKIRMSSGSAVMCATTWSILRLLPAVLLMVTAGDFPIQARDLPLHYYKLALQARQNYEHALATNNERVIKAYYEYALAAYDDYAHSYRALKSTGGSTAGKRVGKRLQLNIDHSKQNKKQFAQSPTINEKKTANHTKEQKNSTSISVSTGLGSDTNASARPDIITPKNDYIFSATATLVNENAIDTNRKYHFRTGLNFDARFNLKQNENSYDLFSLKLGPVIRLSEKWRLSSLPFIQVNLLNYEYMANEGGFFIALENTDNHFIDTVTIKFGRETFSTRYAEHNASKQEIGSNFVLHDPFGYGDAFAIKPTLSYIKANKSRYTYLYPGLRIQYHLPLTEELHLGLLMSHNVRLYEGSGPNVSQDRRDFEIVASPSLTLNNILFSDIALITHYQFLNNSSNDSTHQFESHSVGVAFKWSY